MSRFGDIDVPDGFYELFLFDEKALPGFSPGDYFVEIKNDEVVDRQDRNRRLPLDMFDGAGLRSPYVEGQDPALDPSENVIWLHK